MFSIKRAASFIILITLLSACGSNRNKRLSVAAVNKAQNQNWPTDHLRETNPSPTPLLESVNSSATIPEVITANTVPPNVPVPAPAPAPTPVKRTWMCYTNFNEVWVQTFFTKAADGNEAAQNAARVCGKSVRQCWSPDEIVAAGYTPTLEPFIIDNCNTIVQYPRPLSCNFNPCY